MSHSHLKKQFSLKAFNTFQVNCVAECYLPFKNVDELALGMKEAQTYFTSNAATSDTNPTFPRFILGGGSNILLGDKLDGLTIHAQDERIEVVREDAEHVYVRVGAGKNWDEWVAHAVSQNWQGIESLTLIPGNVGASVVQNIGAYGAEASEVVESVTCVNLDNLANANANTNANTNSEANSRATNSEHEFELTAVECAFDYRLSVFKSRPELLVVSVVYRLKKMPVWHKWLPTPSDSFSLIRLLFQSIKIGKQTKYKPKMNFNRVRDILALKTLPIRFKRALVKFIRTKTMPDPKKVANVGCFFKSPIVAKSDYAKLQSQLPGVMTYPHSVSSLKVSAGDLIKLCELNGIEKGNVRVEKNRPLIIVSNGQATGTEINAFAQELRDNVKNQTQLDIEPEVVILAS